MAHTIDEIAAGKDVEVMLASHNQNSVELAVARMKKHNLDPKDTPVYFGQLLG